MIHLEPGHRVVGETIAARLNAPADKREAAIDKVSYLNQQAVEIR